MPVSSQPLLPFDELKAHKNTGLFADHFLNTPERLKNMEEWKRVTGIKEAFDQIASLYDQRACRFSDRTNESQTEEGFIRPVLNLLWGNTCYQVQVRIPTVNGQRQPDYAFFRTAEECQEAEARLGTVEYWRNVPCLGDAKRWAASLDKKRAADEHPSAQMCNYLYRARVRWGMLTNGRIWRLYEREKSSAGGIFYEVNLEELLHHGDPEAFKYFYLFFRRDAFVPDSTGVTFVEKVFQGSVDYATEVGDRLKESVYDALRVLMNGFFEHPANGLDRHDPTLVKAVHENCLILLYRLLFLLYAEDRDLLPRSREPYFSYSLYRLQQEINHHLRQSKTYPPMGRRFWGELTNLFALIDEGYPEGNIPSYNGGLFSPGKYPHIAHTPQPLNDSPPLVGGAGGGGNIVPWQIGDHRLAEVIDMLAYQREKWNEPGTQDIDYTTLDVQHLGSIYEGLLELQPHIAEEPMVETVTDGKPVFKPQREVLNVGKKRHFASLRDSLRTRTINASEVYLVTNRGERKATGSYYTPKYIVDYIVENTLGPLADEASRQVEALRVEVDKEIKKLEKIRREWEKALSETPPLPPSRGELEKSSRGELEKSSDDSAAESPFDETVPESPLEGGKGGVQISNLNKAIEEQKRRLLEPYLSLNVLDPAMGSGHFLVGAADFLSLAMAIDPNLPHLAEMGDEDPQIFYKRLVVERCLYGVDLNPLAVELAKLSLWLHTVSKDKALSFLDHHLHCGNSLIGARIEDDLMTEPPRFNARGKRINVERQQLGFGFTEALSATHLHYFLDTFRKIMEAPSGDAEIERMKDKLYWEMDHVRDKFRAVANCWLAPYFGVPVTPEQYECAVRTLRNPEAEWQALTQEKWFQDAQAVAGDKRFFHWELEFPEIFFDAHGFKSKEERGFDAVVGNPPYGLISDATTKSIVQQTFDSAQYQQDNYVAFMERACRLTSQQGYKSFIVPTTFLTMHYFSAIRRFLLDHCRILTLVHFKFPVFEDPTVESALYVCQIEAEQNKRQTNTVNGIIAKELSDFTTKHLEAQIFAQEQFEESPENDFNIFLGKHESGIIKKMLHGEVESLGKLCEMTVGIKPYQVGKGMPKQTQDMVKNRVFDAPYCKDDTYHQYLMGRDIDRYLIAPLEERWISYGNWLAEPRPAAPFFELKRIIIRQTGDSIIAAIEDKQRLTLNNIHNLRLILTSLSYEYLLAILNSKLITFFHRHVVPEANRVFAEVKIVDLEKLPIRRIESTTPDEEREQLFAESKQLYESYLSQRDNDSVLEFVEHQLTQTPERADVIHDLLAFLAEQMIAMNKEKYEEITGFLTWLERHIGAKVDDLSNKTNIKAYHDHDLDTLLSILRKNHRKLSVNPTTRSVQEPIEREFIASIAKLTPLKAKLDSTDRLIDLIVYQLYDLTDEEIALVEGTSKITRS